MILRNDTVDLDKDEMALLEIIAQDEESLDKALTRIAKMAVRTYFAELNSAQFERLVGRAFTARGYDVKNIGGAGDKGIDLIAKYRNETIAVQCKRYDPAQPITPRQVREFLGAVTAAKATTAVFVTTSTYTAAAREFAVAQGIELVDIMQLPTWLAGRSGALGPAFGTYGPIRARTHVPKTRMCGNPRCRYETTTLSRWTYVWVCPRCGHTNKVTRE